MWQAWSFALVRLAVALALAVLLGLVAGNMALWLAIVLGGTLAWQFFNLFRLQRWLKLRAHEEPPDFGGVWGDVIAIINRIYRRKQYHKRRVTQLFREFRRLSAALPDGAVLLSEGKEIRWFNHTAAELLGLRRKVDIGIPIANLVRDPEFAACLAKPGPGRSAVIRAQGADAWLAVFVIPAGPQYLMLVRDVTREMLQQQKLAAIHQAGVELADMKPDELAHMTVEERIEYLKSNILHYTKDLLQFDVVEIRLLDHKTGILEPLLAVGMSCEATGRVLRAERVGDHLEAQHQPVETLQQGVVQLARDALAFAVPLLQALAQLAAGAPQVGAVQQPQAQGSGRRQQQHEAGTAVEHRFDAEGVTRLAAAGRALLVVGDHAEGIGARPEAGIHGLALAAGIMPRRVVAVEAVAEIEALGRRQGRTLLAHRAPDARR